MIALKPHKLIIAIFLLAVYAFITAPVQLWHHHKHISENAPVTVSPDTKSDILSQGSASSLETNCQVCSHKYSAYNDHVLTPFEASGVVIAATNGCYAPQLVAVSPLLLPNKGPPAVS